MNDSVDDGSVPLATEYITEMPAFGLHGTPEQVDKLFTELALAQGEFEAVLKDTRGQDGNRTFMYADLASMVKASRPALAKHRIAITQYPLGSEGELLTIVSGHGARIHSTLRFRRADMTVAGVPGIKLFGSELTYFSRYALRCILGLPGDDDLDSQPQPQPSQRGERMQPDRPKGNGTAKPPPVRQERAAPPEAPPAQPESRTQQTPTEERPTRAAETEAPPPQVVDDVNGPDGEGVPESGPTIDPSIPMTVQTKSTVQETMRKLFSPDGTKEGVTMDVRTKVFKSATGRPLVKDDPLSKSEWAGQRMVDLMYELATEHGIDPDTGVTRDDVGTMLKALGKRAGV